MRELLRLGARRRLLSMCLIAATITSACQPLFGTPSGPVRHATLTATQGLSYRYVGDDVSVTANADAPFPDGNVREVFWRDQSVWDANPSECMTWNTTAGSTSQIMQPGVAVRIAPTGPDNAGVKAVTVTENIWSYGVWLFNVHVWDSTQAAPFTLIETFDLSSIVGKVWKDEAGAIQSTLVAPPWHVCAAAYGNQFSFKVWTGTNPEPAWDDTTHVFTTTLPDGWDYPGAAGGYIGHLKEGMQANYSDMTQSLACADAVLEQTPTCQDLISHLPNASSTSTSTTSTVPNSSTTVVPTTSIPEPTTTLISEPTTTASVPVP